MATEWRAYTSLRDVRLRQPQFRGSIFAKCVFDMAIYHFSVDVISRSQGRSAVACAAYRSAEKLQDQRYDKTHDYTRKEDVIHKEILLPEGAPTWMADRETLWNAVEAYEKRKDAQLARQVEISLPRELTEEQNITLAREFIQEQFVSKGMVADWAFHNDSMLNGEKQPHVHVMLTMREITPEGFGQKVREWNAKENLLVWREAWAEVANRHLFLHGHDIKIDHRSFEAQGIDLEPQYKIGAATAREKMARFADHQRIAQQNGERILAEPKVALDAITRQQSTFTHHDLARFVNRHTVDAEQFQTVYETLKASDELVHLGKDGHGRDRYTTKELLAIETKMLEQSSELAARDGHKVGKGAADRALAVKELSSEQTTAFEHLTDRGDLKCVIGFAGTGKSYMLDSAREAWEAQGYNVRGATLSGIAAQNLEASSGIESRTLASRMYYWNQGRQLLTDKDVLVVDEAGMIGSRQMGRVLDEAHRSGAKVVLIGDPEQLQAIEAGAAFRAIAERTGYVELTEIRRQRVEWQREATRELATGRTEQALDRYRQHDNMHGYETQAAAQRGMLDLWNDARISNPEKTQIMFAYTRKEVRELNEAARDRRKALSELGTEHTVKADVGERIFAENDRIYFLKNDRGMDVKNGTLGTVREIKNDRITVQLDRDERRPKEPGRLVTVELKDYNYFDHGYAATAYKGQGVTVDRAYILASKHFDRHATYVSASRHRDSADLFWSKESFVNEQALSKTLSRERLKDVSLDYSPEQEYAQSRGVNTGDIILPKARDKEANKSRTHESKAEQYAKYEKMMQQASKEFDRTEAKKLPAAREDLRQIKADFEAKNPDAAKEIRAELMPRHERQALEIQKQMGLLEKAIEKSTMPRTAREQLLKYAANVSKSDVMAYLKQHNKELAQKVEGLSKSHGLELERGGRGRSRGR